VAGKQLTFADANVFHRLDGVIQWQTAKAVGLNADANAADFGVHLSLSQRQCKGNARQSQFPELSS
jgi:hypothetical protein